MSQKGPGHRTARQHKNARACSAITAKKRRTEGVYLEDKEFLSVVKDVLCGGMSSKTSSVGELKHFLGSLVDSK